MSSIGKGMAAASIGALLQARGYRIKIKKLDPYINAYPGLLSPYKHGETFVMEDGCEADLDFGHYERFTDIRCTSKDSLTTGKVYTIVLEKEKNGAYNGSDIQVIPHITNEIKSFILYSDPYEQKDVDFTICEIGGTVGDIEGLPYLETIRQINLEIGKDKVMFIHLTYIIHIPCPGELKTKPSQHSVKTLQSLGIQPDILLCRSEKEIDVNTRDKLSLFCNVKKENIIEALNVKNIYMIPKTYFRAGLDRQICHHFNLYDPSLEKSIKLSIENKWGKLENRINNLCREIKVAIIAKFAKSQDAYISLLQAVTHAGTDCKCKINVLWIDSSESNMNIEKELDEVDGIIIHNGDGSIDAKKKIEAIRFARIKDIPLLGIGDGIKFAIAEEFLPEHYNDNDIMEFLERIKSIDDSAKKGEHYINIADNSLAYKVYNGLCKVKERYKNNYHIDLCKVSSLSKNTERMVICSGVSNDNKNIEIIERPEYNWFLAVIFYPEFKSNPFNPHPIFTAFINAILK